MTDTDVCEHKTAPECTLPGCGEPQKLNRRGHPMGVCDGHFPEHVTERAVAARRSPVGTIAAGPKGRGWRVKTSRGWRPCDAQGHVIRRRVGRGDSTAADPNQLTDTQRHVLFHFARLGVAGATDHVIMTEMPGAPSSASKRRLELQRAGLIEDTNQHASVRRNSSATVWRITPAGAELATRLHLEGER